MVWYRGGVVSYWALSTSKVPMTCTLYLPSLPCTQHTRAAKYKHTVVLSLCKAHTQRQVIGPPTTRTELGSHYYYVRDSRNFQERWDVGRMLRLVTCDNGSFYCGFGLCFRSVTPRCLLAGSMLLFSGEFQCFSFYVLLPPTLSERGTA